MQKSRPCHADCRGMILSLDAVFCTTGKNSLFVCNQFEVIMDYFFALATCSMQMKRLQYVVGHETQTVGSNAPAVGGSKTTI